MTSLAGWQMWHIARSPPPLPAAGLALKANVKEPLSNVDSYGWKETLKVFAGC